MNDILPYIEISKPKLRNNLNHLFAMKNSILILCLLFAGVTFSQGLPKTQIFDAYDSRTDSIVVYKVSDDVYTNKLRIFRILKTYKHEEAAGDVVSVSYDNKAEVVFESNGVYAIQCFRGGVDLKPSFLHVDDKYVNSFHRVLNVGHRDHYYYYVQ